MTEEPLKVSLGEGGHEVRTDEKTQPFENEVKRDSRDIIASAKTLGQNALMFPMNQMSIVTGGQ